MLPVLWGMKWQGSKPHWRYAKVFSFVVIVHYALFGKVWLARLRTHALP